MTAFSLDLPQNTMNTLIYKDEVELPFEYETTEATAFFTALASQIEQYGMNSAYRVGAVYFGEDSQGREFLIPCVNTVPDKILEVFNGQERIADSHMTVHAEMEGMIRLPQFERLNVAVSRPICPTCLEGLSVLSNAPTHGGHVDMVYMDDQSLAIKSTQEKWSISKSMVQKVAKRGGLGLAFIDIKSGQLSKTLVPPTLTAPHTKTKIEIENPVVIETLDNVKSVDQLDIGALLRRAESYAETSTIPENQEAVILVGKDQNNKITTVTATASLPPGFFAKQDQALFEQDQRTTKRSYLYQMDALKRALINAHVSGIDLHGSLAVCTTPPSAGMLVNAVGYGVQTIATSHNIEFEQHKVRDHLFLEFIRAGVLDHRTPHTAHRTESP